MPPSEPPDLTNTVSQPNLDLLPRNKFDEEAIAHLHTLPPSLWTPLIDLTHPIYPTQTPISNACSLIDWIADINWPITQPICALLLTLVNDPDKREKYGDVFVHAVKRVLQEVDEWDWMYVALACLVDGIEDRAWMREMFGDALRGLRGRVPREEWEGDEGWELGEVVGKCLDEEAD